MKRRPDPPGTILREKFMKPFKITRERLANHLGWSVKQVDRICDNESKITPEKALRLGAAFQVQAEFWLKLQNIYDLSSLQLTDLISPLVDKDQSEKIIKNIKLPRSIIRSRRKYEFDKLQPGEFWIFKRDSLKELQILRATMHTSLKQFNLRYNARIQITTKINGNELKVWRLE